jgi:hypothetical protein
MCSDTSWWCIRRNAMREMKAVSGYRKVWTEVWRGPVLEIQKKKTEKIKREIKKTKAELKKKGKSVSEVLWNILKDFLYESVSTYVSCAIS